MRNLPPITFLSFLLSIGCEEPPGPGAHHDFVDDTTGAAVGSDEGLELTSTSSPESVTPEEDTPPESATPEEDTPPESDIDSIEDPPMDLHVGTPQACDDEVPEACLEITHDTAHCNDLDGCNRSACIQRVFADFRVAMIRCLERECDVEPLYDTNCLDRWNDLEEACITEFCSVSASTCQAMAISGWQAECRR